MRAIALVIIVMLSGCANLKAKDQQPNVNPVHARYFYEVGKQAGITATVKELKKSIDAKEKFGVENLKNAAQAADKISDIDGKINLINGIK